MCEEFILKKPISEVIQEHGAEETFSSDMRLANYKIGARRVARLFSDHKRRRRLERVVVNSEIEQLKETVERLRAQIDAPSEDEQTPTVGAVTPDATKVSAPPAPAPKQSKKDKTATQRRSERQAKSADGAEANEDIIGSSNIFEQS